MLRFGAALLVFLTLAGSSPAQVVDRAPADDKGTYLGALFRPVSEALYAQLPQLPRNHGVLVTHVLPDSPAARADLRRHDIVVRYNDQKVRDCEHFARLIQADKPDRKVRLAVLRGGREAVVEAKLGLGPALKITPAVEATSVSVGVPRGIAKPAGPPPVSVSATPLESGGMKITIEFYHKQTGRLRTVTCEGTAQDIDRAVEHKVPQPERNLVQVALRRIRELNSQKK